MENIKQQKITIPVAIIIAGFLIMVGILLTNNGNKVVKEKTLSEQVGVSKEQLTKCLEESDVEGLLAKTGEEASKAMEGIQKNERGTPYSVIIGSNGIKTQIRGAYPKEDIKKLIDEVNAGVVTDPYIGNISNVTTEDHIIGNINAPIIIVEYSDFDCPYCKKFGNTMKEIVAESNGNVAWVYRHWVVHQSAVEKTIAAECVSKIKGNDAFWKYTDLVFGLMDKVKTPITNQL